jgi:hypothetical protein
VEKIVKSSSFRRQLEKQAKLVLSENEVLMERQELQNKKLEEVTAFYKEEGIYMHACGRSGFKIYSHRLVQSLWTLEI